MYRMSQREWAFEQWLKEIRKDYPDDYDVASTRFGCAVYDGDGNLVDEWDYEPPEDNPAATRY